jgi:predicted choloylglycine hydrolase
MYLRADFLEPKAKLDIETVAKRNRGSLRKNRYGLWEAHIKGDALERGATYGVLCSELIKHQENTFYHRMHELVPSHRWVEFLHKVIIFFNRNMARHIPEEYRKEIYAMSLSASNEYTRYGSNYVRQLNYHAAHDIGHAMQEYMLVGCTSFAAWGSRSATGEIIVARNFDFYLGDDFAKNKIVLFVEPTEGYRFVSLAWPGMMGVVSGMNEHGLTITLNALKGDIPTSSAIPISILARHIMQQATTIDEAYAIAKEAKSFVSEAMLVASAKDGCAAIIEKTPKCTAIYRSEENQILCTNHAQSEELKGHKHNLENMATSDSPYRYERLKEFVELHAPIDIESAIAIMRDTRGKGDSDIGLGNEKAVNQLIAFHSVVFEPTKLRLWVSTAPWQLGEFVCYDLNKIFSGELNNRECYTLEELTIPADEAAIAEICPRVTRFRELCATLRTHTKEHTHIAEEVITEFSILNPSHYLTHDLLGDYMMAVGDRAKATTYWQRALELEIPHAHERGRIERKIKK